MTTRDHHPDGEAAPPARILVVDDEESITQLVSTVLRYEGFEVESALDGKAAIKVARAFKPDLVVLDVMLPDWDGFEVYRRLADGLPVGLQIMAPALADDRCYRVAAAVEAAQDAARGGRLLEPLAARAIPDADA